MLMAALTRRNILERLAQPVPESLQCSAVEVKRPDRWMEEGTLRAGVCLSCVDGMLLRRDSLCL